MENFKYIGRQKRLTPFQDSNKKKHLTLDGVNAYCGRGATDFGIKLVDFNHLYPKVVSNEGTKGYCYNCVQHVIRAIKASTGGYFIED